MQQESLRLPLLAVLITIVVSFTVWFGVHYFLTSNIEKDILTIQQERGALSRTTTLAAQTADLKAQEPIAASYERVISVLLPTQEQLLEVPRTVEQFGRTQGVEAEFTFTGSGQGGVVQPGSSLPFTVRATGPSNRLALFFKDFEVRIPRYTFDVTHVDLAGSLLQPEQYSLSLRGTIFYQ